MRVPLRVAIYLDTLTENMFTLPEVMVECCRAHPGQPRRAQPAVDEDNRAVVGAYK